MNYRLNKKHFKTDIKIVIFTVIFLSIFAIVFPKYGVDHVIQDATIDYQNGNLAIVSYESNVGRVVSVYDQNANLEYSTVIEDTTGGRASVCLWYENSILYAGLKSGGKSKIFQISDDATVLYVETIDGSLKAPWESGWKKNSSRKTIELDGVVYCYDNKNFFTKVFFNQQRNMTIQKYESEPIEVWNSNDGHKT